MAMDGSDYNLVKAIREQMERLNGTNANILKQQGELLKAFNQIASGLDRLNENMEALREAVAPRTTKKKLG